MCELSRVCIFEAREQFVGDDKTQNPVSKEFQALVVASTSTGPAATLDGAWVRQGFVEQFGPFELVTE